MWKKRTPALVTTSKNNGCSGLVCPRCNDVWLHQGNVTAYHRAKEDAPYTTVLAQHGDEVIKTTFPSGETHNPSSRRTGLTIEFECEQCEEPLTLAIYQHKGNTYLEWVE